MQMTIRALIIYWCVVTALLSLCYLHPYSLAPNNSALMRANKSVMYVCVRIRMRVCKAPLASPFIIKGFSRYSTRKERPKSVRLVYNHPYDHPPQPPTPSLSSCIISYRIVSYKYHIDISLWDEMRWVHGELNETFLCWRQVFRGWLMWSRGKQRT